MEAIQTLVCWLALLDGVPAPGPTLQDAQRFPPHAVAVQQTRLAWDHYQWLGVQVPLDLTHRDWLLAQREQAYRTWYVIDDVRLATDPGSPEWTRLAVLARLREWLGPEDWWAGRLPPPVPLWRFQRVLP